MQLYSGSSLSIFPFPLAEISIKQQSVEQLEGSQQSLLTLRLQYEEKIEAIESEIDRLLEELGKVLVSFSARMICVLVVHCVMCF